MGGGIGEGGLGAGLRVLIYSSLVPKIPAKPPFIKCAPKPFSTNFLWEVGEHTDGERNLYPQQFHQLESNNFMHYNNLSGTHH